MGGGNFDGEVCILLLIFRQELLIGLELEEALRPCRIHVVRFRPQRPAYLIRVIVQAQSAKARELAARAFVYVEVIELRCADSDCRVQAAHMAMNPCYDCAFRSCSAVCRVLGGLESDIVGSRVAFAF